ncbi:MAG: TRAP transporter substrate-binding protein DctP [Planctomycetes bacterium]|nr:TRAP transporter substrate-binding protein DctP [Planctomycetota bacterium]
MTPSTVLFALASFVAASAPISVSEPPAEALGETKLRLATIAPKDSSVHRALQEMGEAWKGIDPPMKLLIHSDGSMGGEADVVKKMRVGQLQAALLTVTGLSEIDPSVTALQNMPLLYRTLDEAAAVRVKLEPMIRERMRAQGFELLFLGDLGWVHFFSVKPVVRPDDLKKVKLFTWTGDVKQVDLMKSMGLNPVPLEPTDILVGLQTGLVDAVPMVPFFAQIAQLHDKAKYMLELDWAPLVGGGVMTKKCWDELDDAHKALVLRSAGKAGEKIITQNRIEARQSIEAMQKKGLIVTPVTPELADEWRRFMEPVYPKLRGNLVPAELFDAAVKTVEALRTGAEAKR